jgi:hypothetical protein
MAAIKVKTKKEIYYQCRKCDALEVDRCEYYIRLIGDEKDRQQIKK